jgi:hypothetical protein
LEGNYPNVAIDGNQAVVASGSGSVVFYKLEQSIWTKADEFTDDGRGEVTSVAISGNYAVVGVPMAMCAGCERELETGVIFIYVRNDGKWAQLEGAYVPDEYRITVTDEFDKARFGLSVDIDDDLIVVGAPEENEGQGSITVFRRDDNDRWVEMRRVEPGDLCGVPFFGYSVQVYNDWVAASADCNVNVVLYERIGARLVNAQQLNALSRGAVSSISMSWDSLVYSTVQGRLYFFNKQAVGDEGWGYVLDQEMGFRVVKDLYEYPTTMDANMLSLSVANDVFVYSRSSSTDWKWKRENIVLEAQGEFASFNGRIESRSGCLRFQRMRGIKHGRSLSQADAFAHGIADCHAWRGHVYTYQPCVR